MNISKRRRLFMVLSPHSLPYARLCIESLYRNCTESFSLSLITDTKDDKIRLDALLKSLENHNNGMQRLSNVYEYDALAEVEQTKLYKFQNIRSFRRGHPCWRKITDPVLLSEDRDEMIILDPDLYFPNQFRFEESPVTGVLLMWQRPSCLLPPEVVESAISANIPLAHHTDIGVAQLRMPVDLEWLDWLIGKLSVSSLPRSMHVESIVWAAIAMKIGGGYLNPRLWVCWHRTQLTRVLIKFGVPGHSILERESFATIKCFHAGGEAKWWLADAYDRGILDYGNDVTEFAQTKPYRELKPSDYRSLQRTRHMLRKLGYYSVFGNA